MEERRQVQRTRVLKGAKIIFNQNASVINCTVGNLTHVGACLRVATSVGIPTAFDLSFDSVHSRRKCLVVWRTADKLGISFQQQQEQPVERISEA